jgi:hypothetical protein
MYGLDGLDGWIGGLCYGWMGLWIGLTDGGWGFLWMMDVSRAALF